MSLRDPPAPVHRCPAVGNPHVALGVCRVATRLPDSKTGAKTITCQHQRSSFQQRGPPLWQSHVIAGAKPGAHLVNLQKPWGRIRNRAGLPVVRLHDLRHSFASMAAAGGLSLPIIGALLGHTQPATTARYAHLAADPLKKAADLAGGRIAAAMRQPRTKLG